MGDKEMCSTKPLGADHNKLKPKNERLNLHFDDRMWQLKFENNNGIGGVETNGKTYSIRYIKKVSDIGATERKKWISKLNQADLR